MVIQGADGFATAIISAAAGDLVSWFIDSSLFFSGSTNVSAHRAVDGSLAQRMMKQAMARRNRSVSAGGHGNRPDQDQLRGAAIRAGT
jgi:hypothetical protein